MNPPTITRLHELLDDPYSITAEEVRWLVENLGDPKPLVIRGRPPKTHPKTKMPKQRVKVIQIEPAGYRLLNKRIENQRRQILDLERKNAILELQAMPEKDDLASTLLEVLQARLDVAKMGA